jgi:hypothetical protein
MREGVQRRPGAVPEIVGDGAGHDLDDPRDVRHGLDTDVDGQPDTVLTVDGADLLVASDLDGDGLADRVLRIGPDGSVHTDDLPEPAAGPVHGSAPAAHSLWTGLLGRLLGPDP